MAAVSPTARAPGTLAPFHRRYDLPWSAAEETERRFRAIMRNFIIAFAILAVVMYFLPRSKTLTPPESLPERVVQLVMEPPPPPPPPPEPPKPEKAPVSAKPTPTPPVPVDPRVKASKSGLLANIDDLAALRNVDVDKFAQNQKNTTDPGDVTEVQRNLITAQSGGSSGGISAPTSSGLAAGSGSLKGIYTTQVKDPKLAAGSGQGARAGGSGKASRSADEIALVFTRNKGAIDAMYARALRDNPALQGKVVVGLTIAPSGEVTEAHVISSDLKDEELEKKLVARIKLFKFEAKDVAVLIATKPIDFFPAG
jgi:outer membrane biosynthesis protein TonB